MRGIKNNQSIFTEALTHSGDLGWMFQGPQVDDHSLVQALVHEYYSGLLRFSYFQSGDSRLANQIAQNTLWTVVHERYRYWGDPPIKVWMYSLAQKTMKGRGLGSPSVDSTATLPPLIPSAQQIKPPLEDTSFESVLDHLSGKQKQILLLR
jgi:DNA-directed RNA polymerase specialized sigma24 family protein